MGLENQYRTLQEIVYTTIKDRILSGEYKQGDKLNTYELAAEFEVSRMPIRDALTRLEASTGLIKLIPHRGAVVATVSDRDLFEIFHIRAVLEGLAARWACKNVVLSEITKMEKINEKIKKIQIGQSEDLFHKLNYEFHSIIWEKANAPQLVSLLKNLYESSRSYRYISLIIPGRLPEIIMEHEEILRELREQNEDELDQTLNKHTRHTYDWLMKNKTQNQ